MLYSLEAMAPTMFNWEEALLPIFKDQLTKFRQGELKQFEFGSILACFFFERVPQTLLHFDQKSDGGHVGFSTPSCCMYDTLIFF